MISREQLKAKLDEQKIKTLSSSNKANYPSFGQMAKGLGNSVIRNVRSVADGNNLKISEADAKHRLDICKSCEFFDEGPQRCRKCGCFMAVKTYLKAEKCPIGKW
jgi:hypothetical protein